MRVWMLARAILPVLLTESGLTHQKVIVEPPNDRIATQVGYWSESVYWSFGRPYAPVKENLNCILPALFAHKNVEGDIDFDVVTTPEQTRVRAKSTKVDKTVVACLEEQAQRRLEVNFRRRFASLVQDYKYLEVTTPPQKITAEFSTLMHIRHAPELEQ